MKYAQRNFGGSLQARALCHELEKRGIQYEIIRYEKRDSVIKKIKSIPRILNIVLISDKIHRVKKAIAHVVDGDFKKNDLLRVKTYKEYSDRAFENLSPVFRGYEQLRDAARSRYDAVMVGSDQLWSPSGLPTNFYNLMFVPDSVTKISVASSFGVSQIPWYQKRRTSDYLKRIEYISMRENRGKEIVKELTGRDVPVVADPVLLLSAEEWDSFVPIENKYKEPYVFAYFLGTNTEHRKAVAKFAQEKRLKIVAMRHIDQYVPIDNHFGDYTSYDANPNDFLNILRNAKYVFTDSFHGALFSVIYHKDFVVFNRYSDSAAFSKNSRIDSLCTNLGLEHRRYKGNLQENLDTPTNYEAVDKNVSVLITVTKEYLDNALSGL